MSHLCKRSHVRLLRQVPPRRRRRCALFRAEGGSGPHGEERGPAMFKKCAQRGLASCGLKLYNHIGSFRFSLKGYTGWRAVGVCGRGNSSCPFKACLNKMAMADTFPSEVQRE